MFLPYPYPHEKPEQPSSLEEQVDWMAWSHPRLYRMVHEGLDPVSADKAAQRWAKIARNLHEIADDLAKAVGASESGWQGEAADRARDGMRTVVAWSGRTGDQAAQLSTAIDIQNEHVTVARSTMPEPVGPTPVPGDYSTMAQPVSWKPSHTAHEAAAEVMTRFQNDSLTVVRSVPSFEAPTNPMSYDGSGNPKPPGGGTGTGTHTGTGIGSGTGGGTGGPGSGGQGTGGPGSAVGTRVPGPGGLGTGRGVAGEPLAARPAGESGRMGAAAGRSGVSGMPMGGAGARGEDDLERKAPAYLKEDDDIFGVDVPLVPPVLGVDPRG